VANDIQISNIDVAVYALARLGGAGRNVYSEDVAALCYELAPSRFGWRLEKYRKRKWPDKYVVRFALEDAKKPENGALVEGVYAVDLTKDGWRLTPGGVRWLQSARKRVETALRLGGSALPRRDAHHFKRQVRNQELFKRFVNTGTVDSANVYLFADLLTCSPDAPVEVVSAKFRRVQAMAELMRDRIVLTFLEACAHAFPQYRLTTRSKSAVERETADESKGRPRN